MRVENDDDPDKLRRISNEFLQRLVAFHGPEQLNESAPTRPPVVKRSMRGSSG